MKIQNQHQMRQQLLYIIILLSLTLTGYSQESGSCAEKLKNAQSLFDKGQVEQVASIISDCMKSGFNREESLSAYKLIIQTYLFEDELGKADSAMLDFLKRNPEYELSPTDHSSFVSLFNTFRVKSVVQISVHLGTNLPFITFVSPVTTASEPGKSIYSSKAVNLFGSIEARFKLSNKFELSIEPGYSQLAFTNVEEFMSIGNINYTETQQRIEVPLSATYNFKSFGKFTPYARLGFGPALTLASTAKASLDPKDLNGTPREGTDLDIKKSRISMDLFSQAGAGLKFKTRGGFLFVEARSNIGIFNQTVRGELTAPDLSSEELRYYYSFEDDDFHLNSVNISVGYTRIFYKPSKRKE